MFTIKIPLLRIKFFFVNALITTKNNQKQTTTERNLLKLKIAEVLRATRIAKTRRSVSPSPLEELSTPHQGATNDLEAEALVNLFQNDETLLDLLYQLRHPNHKKTKKATKPAVPQILKDLLAQ